MGLAERSGWFVRSSGPQPQILERRVAEGRRNSASAILSTAPWHLRPAQPPTMLRCAVRPANVQRAGNAVAASRRPMQAPLLLQPSSKCCGSDDGERAHPWAAGAVRSPDGKPKPP